VQNMFAYPLPALQGSWNLLGSHDTERIMTACGGDPRKAALAAVFNMTWIGTPVIYYGDEIGMEGETDPDCRRPMIWDRAGAAATGPSGEGVAPGAERAAAAEGKSTRRGRWNEPLFQLYKRLVRLRRRTGSRTGGAAKRTALSSSSTTRRGRGRCRRPSSLGRGAGPAPGAPGLATGTGPPTTATRTTAPPPRHTAQTMR